MQAVFLDIDGVLVTRRTLKERSGGDTCHEKWVRELKGRENDEMGQP